MKIKKPKDSDFLPNPVETWCIWIQKHEMDLPKRYMNTAYDTEYLANEEVKRIKRHYSKIGDPIFNIEVRKQMMRKLKKPISIK